MPVVCEFESVVRAEASEVFSWFARPGALARLTPPWTFAYPLAESEDLRAGRAVLGFPLGLRWVAQHDPQGYVPGRGFVDQAVSFPFRQITGGWRHAHSVAPLGDGRARVVDEVRTRVPRRLLVPMFAFRHHQLAGDLAASQRADGWSGGKRRMTIAMTGADGVVGSALRAVLTTNGHTVIRLTRAEPSRPDQRRWEPDAPAEDLLDGADVLVHLAGASIAGRFDERHKAEIRESRVGPTRALAELVARPPHGPKSMVCASAIGYYGADRGDEELDESSARGDGFLADVVADWEQACKPAADAGARVATIRTGVVQSARRGVLALTRLLFSFGLGGRLGGGGQWTSWIALDDLCDIYHRAIVDDRICGPVNAVADPVRNSEYTAILAGVLRRPALLPVPTAGLKLVLGDTGARELALADQRVVPGTLNGFGHLFRYPHLRQALAHELGHEQLPSGETG